MSEIKISQELLQDPEVRAKYELLQKKRNEEYRKTLLPHLYGFPLYTWAKEFIESTNKMNFLCAANQVSKSSTQIRKAILWATDRTLWPSLWQRQPTMFWYLYPDKSVATIEFEKKWIPEFLPQGAMKDDPYFGWEEEYEAKKIKAIHFKSGVSIYFKSYNQDAKDLQTGTCHAIFCDEELIENLYDEIKFRLSATNGYFHMVFTATIGQQIWYDTMERIGQKGEKFHQAFKRVVSLYECKTYHDGTPSPWTTERIKEMEAGCSTKHEVLKRIHGRFIRESGQQFPFFIREKHFRIHEKIPADWLTYSAVDPGSGGKAHPAGIVFVAVSPDMTRGIVFKGWRGDGVLTASPDILAKWRELRGKLRPVMNVYDFASADFNITASRAGETFQAANKSKDAGFGLLDDLFKLNMLSVAANCIELEKLAGELESLPKGYDPKKHKDDLVSALRYICMAIPWNMEALQEIMPKEEKKKEAKGRVMEAGDEYDNDFENDMDKEIEAYNELLEDY